MHEKKKSHHKLIPRLNNHANKQTLHRVIHKFIGLNNQDPLTNKSIAAGITIAK